jgi:rhamnose transport system ATP-binding protein
VARALELQGLSKSFAGARALDDVSFSIEAGEVMALVGENGAGKSTLVRIVTGAHAPDAGRVVVAGTEMPRADPLLSRSLGIAPIYQQPALFPDLSVAENLALGLERGGSWRRIDWRARRKAARELLDRVGAEIDIDAPAGTLRMAEQQLVEIARAVGSKARVLLMDEPTAALSDREADRLFARIRELKTEGVAILYISHRLDELAGIADRVTVLRDGKVVATKAMADTGTAELIRLMVGREVSAVFPKRPVPIGGEVLSAKGIGNFARGVRDVASTCAPGRSWGCAVSWARAAPSCAASFSGSTPRTRAC